MGFGEFIVLCLLVCVIAYLGLLVLRLVVPDHPAAVDRIVWGVAILIIVVALLRALGLFGHDVAIPRLF